MKIALLLLGALLPLAGMAAPHTTAISRDDTIFNGVRIVTTSGNKVPWVTVVKLDNESGAPVTIHATDLGYYENKEFIPASAFMTDKGDADSMEIPHGPFQVRVIFRGMANKHRRIALVQWAP